MTVLLMVLVTFFSGWLGYFCGRSCSLSRHKAQISETHRPASALWLERHQRLRNQSQLAKRHQFLQGSRKQVHQQTLQLQLSPHFMFNALSSVQWLWSEGQHQRASQLFANFVTLWHHYWRSDDTMTQTLRDEMQSLKAYLMLEEQRLNRNVKMTFYVEANVPLDGHIPSLLLQPSLENALWHGMDDSIKNPTIEIRISQRQMKHGDIPWVNISMRDNGIGLSSKVAKDVQKESRDHHSMGTKITKLRIKEIHPEAHFELANAANPWSTEVRITLPLTLPNS